VELAGRLKQATSARVTESTLQALPRAPVWSLGPKVVLLKGRAVLLLTEELEAVEEAEGDGMPGWLSSR